MLGNRAIRCQKPLGVARGCKPLHTPLPLTRGLVRVFCPVVEIPVLAMFDTRQDFTLGCTIAFQLIGDDHPRHVLQALEQLAEELLRRLLVPSTLDQDVQHVAFLIHRSPQVMLRTLYAQKRLIHVPCVARAGPSASQLVGVLLLLERPIRVNDIVTVGDQTGVVKHITIRATAIQNGDNQTVIIPNKAFIAHRVINWTLGDTCIRLALPVRVAYGSDLDLVKRLLTELVSSHPRVLTTPAPSVFLQAFGEQALQWDISCFVARPADRPTTDHDLLLQIE